MTTRHAAILSSLQTLPPRLRFWLKCLGVLEVLAAAALWVVASFALDWLFELPTPARVVFLAVLGVGCLRLAQVARRRFRRELAASELAAVVECSSPELDGHLLNVLELPGEISRLGQDPRNALERSLLDRALEESSELAEQARLGGKLNLAPVGWRALALVVAGALVGGVAVSWPASFSLWLRRNVFLSGEIWPRQTHFVLDRPEVEWHQARKDPLQISGWVTGLTPRQVVLKLSSEGSRRDVLVLPGAVGSVSAEAALEARRGEGVTDSSPPLTEGRRLVYTIPSLTDPIEFHFQGGDNQSRSVKVQVHDRPRILSTRCILRFPDYLKLEPKTVENPGADIAVPAGTLVELEAQADQELAKGWSRYGAGEREAAKVEGRIVRLQFLPKENGYLDLAVTEAVWQLESEPPLRLAFVVLPDRSPTIVLSVAGEERVLTPQGRIRWRATTEDDHGFSSGSLKTWPRAAQELRPDEELEAAVTPLDGPAEPFEGGVRSVSEGEISIESLGLKTGASLSLQAFVADNDTLAGPKTAISQKETFQIIDPEDLRKEMDKVRLEAQALLENLSRREEEVAQDLAKEADKAEERATPESKARQASKSSSAPTSSSPKSKSRSSSEPSESASAEASSPSPQSESSASKSASAQRSKPRDKKASPKAAAGAKDSKAAPKEAEPREETAKDQKPDVASQEEPKEAPGDESPQTASASQETSNGAGSKSKSKAGSKAAAKSANAAKGAQSDSNPESPSEEPASSENDPQPSEEPQQKPTDEFKKLGEEQSKIAKEAALVAKRLRDMADSLKRNNLLKPAEENRFEEEISKPLDEVAEKKLPESADEIEAVPDANDAAKQTLEAQRRAEKIADQMKQVAGKLAGAGDFREILQRLELIIDIQKKTISETEKHVPAQPVPGKESPK